MPRNIIDFSSIKGQIESISNRGKRKTTAADPRFYNLTFNEGEERATAVIRFLPPPVGETQCIVTTASHFFRYKTPEGEQVFSENCPRAIGQKCPVCDQFFAHKDDKRLSRTESYISNILVIKDPNRPENEGKVFLFRFKKDVYKKVSDATSPQDDIDQPMNIYDLEKAPNLKLVGHKQSVPGFSKPVTRYVDSTWTPQGPIVIKGEQMDDAYLDGINERVYSLKEFTDPERYKSYDEIKGKLDLALNVLTEIPADEELAPADTVEVSKPATNADKFVSSADTVGANFFDDL